MKCSWLLNPIPSTCKFSVYVTADAIRTSRTLKNISVCQGEAGGKATQEAVSGSFGSEANAGRR
jgi:hypothetical protein